MDSDYCECVIDGFSNITNALFALKSKAADGSDRTLYTRLVELEAKAEDFWDEFESLVDEFREEE